VGTNSSGQFVDASSTVLTNNISGNAATATTATHASNLPADFATQSLASPANGSFNTISAGNTIAAGTSTPTTIGATGVTFPDGTVQSTKAVSLLPLRLMKTQHKKQLYFMRVDQHCFQFQHRCLVQIRKETFLKWYSLALG
jgi:hypothetical protein